MDAPCKNCEERQVGCHSVCPYYKAFVETNEIVKKRVHAAKDDYRFGVERAVRLKARRKR